GEAFLYALPVESVGVVAGPDLFDAPQNIEIDAPAAAGAGFDFQGGMFGAQPIQDLVKVQHVPHPDFALIGGGGFGPAGLREGAVHVPLEVAHVVFGGELVEEAEDVLLDVVARQVEDHLGAQFGARAAGEVDHPIGMGAVEIAVGVDHLRLHPESEIHFEGVDVIDEALESLREFFRVDGPIAESGIVVIAPAEPAIVHHEEFHAELGGFRGEVFLSLLVDRESGGLPGVVEHWAEARRGAAGEDLLAREAVEHARGGAEAGGGEAAIEGRRFQGFAGLERPGEIEGVEAAGDAYLAVGRLFDGHAPIAAPAEGAEPDGAVLFAGVARIDGEPRIEIVAGVALAAFQHLLPFVDGLVIHLGLGGPAAAEVGELIAFARRQVPGGRLRALYRQRARRGVANGRRAAQDAVVGIDAVVEGDFDRVVDVLQDDIEIVAGDAMGGVAEDQIAAAVLAGDLECGLVIARAAPAGELLGFQHLAGVEGGDVAAGGRRGQIVGAP